MKVLSRINRQDAKSAKKSAKKNSFQAAKDFRVSGTEGVDNGGPGPSPDVYQLAYWLLSEDLDDGAIEALSPRFCHRLPRAQMRVAANLPDSCRISARAP